MLEDRRFSWIVKAGPSRQADPEQRRQAHIAPDRPTSSQTQSSAGRPEANRRQFVACYKQSSWIDQADRSQVVQLLQDFW